MITSGVGDGPAPLTAAEGGTAVTGSLQPATAGPWSLVPVLGGCAEPPSRNQRTLALADNIDVTTDEAVRDRAARCLRDQPDVLIVDLRDLNFCDHAGVRVLRWVLRRAALVGATVHIVPPGAHLCRVLKLLGADDLLAAIISAGSVSGSTPGHRGRLPAVQGTIRRAT
jgi:anti-anti-sigma factor